MLSFQPFKAILKYAIKDRIDMLELILVIKHTLDLILGEVRSNIVITEKQV